MTGTPSDAPSRSGRATACVVCERSFAGRRYLRNWWGDAFCEDHPTCDSCGRPGLEADAWTCAVCRADAVTIRDEAVRALLRVNRWMTGLGVGLPLAEVPLRFLDDKFLDDKRPALVANPALTHTEELRRTDHRGVSSVERRITGIEVVRGLTTVQTSSLLAHELTHAWLFLWWVPLGGGALEEGAAELVRWFWLRDQPGHEAAYRRHALETNPDPVYGDGFRAVRDRYRGEPLGDFLRSLAPNGG